MKKLKRMDIVLLALSTASFAGQLFVLSRLPDTVPIHWNTAGEADGFASRYLTLLLAAVPLILQLLFFLIPRVDPKKQNYEKHRKAYDIFRMLASLAFILLLWVSNASILGWPVSVSRVTPIVIGLLLLIVGNYMPQIRFNYTLGIKTPWSLASPYVWRKTQAAGGLVFCLYGILLIAAGIVSAPWMAKLIIAVILLGLVGLYVYSWFLYQKKGPSETNSAD